MALKRGLTRREFLTAGTGGLLGIAGLSLLAACQPQERAARHGSRRWGRVQDIGRPLAHAPRLLHLVGRSRRPRAWNSAVARALSAGHPVG